MIAWERSRTTSGYGIIWGETDRKQTRTTLVRNVIAWIGKSLKVLNMLFFKFQTQLFTLYLQIINLKT